jgi:4-aminobutyrate aminotransferase-like enzyme
MKLYEDDKLYDNAAKLGPLLRKELDAIQSRIRPKTFVRSLGLLGALEIEAPADSWQRLGVELGRRKLSLHVDPKRGTAIFSPPLCITEDELARGMRSFGDAAVAAFGGVA